jgi:hypothetical protein
VESVRELGGILSNVSMSVCRVTAMPLSTRDAGCSQHVGAVSHRARTRSGTERRTRRLVEALSRLSGAGGQRDHGMRRGNVSGIGCPRWGGSNGGGVRVES